MKITFTVPGDPVAAPRPRVTRAGGVYTSAQYGAYRDAVAWAFKAASGRLAPASGPVAMRISFFLKTARPRDLDNLAKSVLDALNGLAFIDDAQVCELHLRKRRDPENPRAVVRIVASRAQADGRVAGVEPSREGPPPTSRGQRREPSV